MNGVLFVISIGMFLWITVKNTLQAIGRQPSNSRCGSLKGDTRWAQWLPGAFFNKPPVLFCNSTWG